MWKKPRGQCRAKPPGRRHWPLARAASDEAPVAKTPPPTHAHRHGVKHASGEAKAASQTGYGPQPKRWGLFVDKAVAAHIYLDESGDLGWQLEKPHNRGESSQYLVIAALVVPPQKDHLPERRLRHLYKSRHWQTANEKKWARMSPAARSAFAATAAGIARDHPDIGFRAIVVQKRNVMDHIRTDPNKLYNYTTRLLLLEEMAQHDTIHFVPDPRSMRVESGRSLHDYLQTELWFTQGASTRLHTNPVDSKHCLNLQFTDMLAGAVQSHFEHGQDVYLAPLSAFIKVSKLYFDRS